jgi:cytoskeleton protein RodZ
MTPASGPSTTSTVLPTTTVAAMTSTTTTTTTVLRLATTTTTSTTVPKPTTTTTTTVPKTTTTTTTITTTTTLPGANAAKPVEVIVEALNAVSIRYALSDGKWSNIDLTAGRVHTFKSRAGMKLEFSDGGAVNLVVNGKDRGVPGPVGKPFNFSSP